jgi:hypothetical protein
MTDRCHIVTLSMSLLFHFSLNVIGLAQTQSLAVVMGQCPVLAHLDLSDTCIGQHGTEILADVLGQCAPLAHLNLERNGIGDAGAERLAGVLGQCTASISATIGSGQRRFPDCCRIAQPWFTSISAKTR